MSEVRKVYVVESAEGRSSERPDDCDCEPHGTVEERFDQVMDGAFHTCDLGGDE